jgi:catechol 2,3-dioxygenase-like lactoylglutathione lyase family enzyme
VGPRIRHPIPCLAGDKPTEPWPCFCGVIIGLRGFPTPSQPSQPFCLFPIRSAFSRMAHINLMAVLVSDYDRAIEFFVEVMGFELVQDEASMTNDGRPKRWVEVRPPGAETGILLARADGDRQAQMVGDQFAGRVGLFLRVDDFDASYRRMMGAGVRFVSEPRREAYGQVVVFMDLEGNRWDLLGPTPSAFSE